MDSDDNETKHLSPRFRESLRNVLDIAQALNHDFITLEHLLLGLAYDPDALDLMDQAGADTMSMTLELQAWLQTNQDLVGSSQRFRTTPEFNKVFETAARDYFERTGKPVDGAMMLATILRDEQKTNAAEILRRHGLTEAAALGYIKERYGIAPPPAGTTTITPAEPAPKPRPAYKLQRGGSSLQRYCTNLNERAMQGKIDSLIGRDDEVSRTVQVLIRRKKNNPMLVGEPGVGKTAIAEGLAKRIVEGDVPENAAQMTIFSLDMGSLVAGTQFRGQFEERIKEVIADAQRTPGAVLFVDEIHTVIGAGSASGQTLDAGNILKPALANGDIRCIGATTYDEFKQFHKKDKALMRRFEKIDIPEPTVADTKLILRGIKGQYEKHHNVRYTDEAIDAAVELSDRYIHNRKQPDKSIDVLDEAGSVENMKTRDRNSAAVTIDVPQIEHIIAKMARIPARQVSRDDKKALAALQEDLKKVVFDQDSAVDALAAKIKISRAGLRDVEKPIGCFVFSGPTGVGKTELAKQLAETMGLKMQRFDMSEYMEKHAVARLIGAPPGYVGHDQGGLLTDAIDKHPYTVLLLDEIEKAHPDIYNLLLQVMDNGKLTDTHGKEVNFRNVVLIMTTNAGAADMQKASMGLGQKDGLQKDADIAAINKLFTPEFRNRLDGVIRFSPLKPTTMGRIVDKFIGKLSKQLKEQGVTIELTQAARDHLAEIGYDERMGARPMARVIEKQIKEPLSEEILGGRLQDGGSVKIDFNAEAAIPAEDGEETKPRLTFSFNSKSAAKAVAGPSKAPRAPFPG